MRLSLLPLLLLLSCADAHAQTVYSYKPVAGAQHGLSTASAVGLTVPFSLGANYAVICARSGSINYTTDGATTPTASVGTPLAAGSCLGLPGSLLATFSAIGSGATLDVEYFK